MKFNGNEETIEVATSEGVKFLQYFMMRVKHKTYRCALFCFTLIAMTYIIMVLAK